MKLGQSIILLLKIYKNHFAKERTVYSPLLNFLKNPNKEFDFDKDNKIQIKKILRFAKGPEKNSISFEF